MTSLRLSAEQRRALAMLATAGPMASRNPC
jgi:hypothetical protein